MEGDKNTILDTDNPELRDFVFLPNYTPHQTTISMNYLDIISALLLAWFAFNGYRKGLIIEVASLAALILGVYAMLYFSDVTASFLIEFFR